MERDLTAYEEGVPQGASGRFALKRITDSKRLAAKLRSVKAERMRRRHQPIPEQGRWLASVQRGHANYGVPGNQEALLAFRFFAPEHWYRARALMADPLLARSVLQELDHLGVEISIDDFETGYSSLAYLTDRPVSEVKIDRSFVSRMAAGSREAVIVNSTVDLGHHLGLRVVAEGVEEPATLQQLKALGCDLAQGYGLSRPLPGADATRRLLHQLGSGTPGVARPAAAALRSPPARCASRLPAPLFSIPNIVSYSDLALRTQ